MIKKIDIEGLSNLAIFKFWDSIYSIKIIGIIGDNSFEPGNLYQIVIEIVITKENITFFLDYVLLTFLD